MSEDWKKAFEAWCAAQHEYFAGPVDEIAQDAFRAGYLAHAETVERLRVALERAAEQFADYANQHRAKSPPDLTKARVNDQMDELCRQALADLQPKETR